MAIKAKTKNFAEFVLRVEGTPPGTYFPICGLTSRGINREHNMNTTEVPFCDDETLPAAVERAVQSSSVTMDATGSFAEQSHKTLYDWWKSGATKNIQIEYLNAASGAIQFEQGPAYLTKLANSVARGEKLSADMSIEFDGIPTVTTAP
jgi:hypothetical protein